MFAVRMKHAQQSLVDVSDAAIGVERKHAGRNALEDRFKLPTALIEFLIRGAQVAAGSLDLAPASFQIFRHAVERAHQIADLVRRTDIDAIVETSAGNLLRRFGEGRQRSSHDLRQGTAPAMWSRTARSS